MLIDALYRTVCPACNSTINIGDKIEWTRGVKARHAVCPDVTKEQPVVTFTMPVIDVPVRVRPTIANITNLFMYLTKASMKLKSPKMRFLANDDKTEIRCSIAPPASRNAGMMYVYVGGLYVGKVRPDGTYQGLTESVTTQLAAVSEDPLRAAKAYAALMGRCSFCGLELTDEGSTKAGYGPICAKHYNLPHESLGTPKLKPVTALPELPAQIGGFNLL